MFSRCQIPHPPHLASPLPRASLSPVLLPRSPPQAPLCSSLDPSVRPSGLSLGLDPKNTQNSWAGSGSTEQPGLALHVYSTTHCLPARLSHGQGPSCCLAGAQMGMKKGQHSPGHKASPFPAAPGTLAHNGMSSPSRAVVGKEGLVGQAGPPSSHWKPPLPSPGTQTSSWPPSRQRFLPCPLSTWPPPEGTGVPSPSSPQGGMPPIRPGALGCEFCPLTKLG